MCIAPCCHHTSKVLMYGTHSQGISVLPAQCTPRVSPLTSALAVFKDCKIVFACLYWISGQPSTSWKSPLNQLYVCISMKLGVMEDHSNRTRLAKLLRFYSSNSDTEMTSLAEYVERMKEKQEHIYFIAGSSRKEVETSPFVERLLKKGYEVHCCRFYFYLLKVCIGIYVLVYYGWNVWFIPVNMLNIWKA